ncbi:hydroxyethylthiazole kinase [Clostridium sp. D2Q-14]|uniref:hydroxyethylthiazole kinase n=1 Tax=Anaeromonas gelatinilytica TaxID=2683194 RepID=UPI00193B296A|nr:hydroxyethylthiazole kinase [Anaeromonas gelatinilytica]MBS4534904.1 hydroxyethylthiazole kinase [Anaeromonas gelatinilytica]
MEILERVSEVLEIIKMRKPLVHHMTNFVTANDCANVTLAIGASPIMAYDEKEVEEVVSMSSSLILNIGTLTSNDIKSMIIAGRKANELNIPVILDPVGVGATNLRTKSIEDILENVSVSVIKGNMSEIKSISGLDVNIRGVDSIADDDNGEAVAQELASKLECIIAITGKRDIISDGNRVFCINNGDERLSRITGTGCMTGSLIASYCGVTRDYLIGAIGGILSMGIAGEIAANLLKVDKGIGSYKVSLFDSIYNLYTENIIKIGEIYEQ